MLVLAGAGFVALVTKGGGGRTGQAGVAVPGGDSEGQSPGPPRVPCPVSGRAGPGTPRGRSQQGTLGPSGPSARCAGQGQETQGAPGAGNQTKGLHNLSYQKCLREVGLFSLENVTPCLKNGCQDGPASSPWCQVIGQENGQKLRRSKVHLNTKNFFTVEVTKQWNRLPREAVSPLAAEGAGGWPR